MPPRKLRQSQLEQISAYLDGELSADLSSRVAERIACDPAWSAVAKDFEKVNTLLEAWQTPPLRRDLTGAILARARQKRRPPGWLRIMAPLGTAAAITVAVWVFHATHPAGRPAVNMVGLATPTGDDALPAELKRLVADVPQEDQFVVENLDLFEDYDVLTNFAALEALEQLERNMDDT